MEPEVQKALIAEAAAQGMIDLDGLKLADLSKVGLNHDGKPVGVRQAISTLKAERPLFFEKPFNASTATKEELAADAKKRGLRIKRW